MVGALFFFSTMSLAPPSPAPAPPASAGVLRDAEVAETLVWTLGTVVPFIGLGIIVAAVIHRSFTRESKIAGLRRVHARTNTAWKARMMHVLPVGLLQFVDVMTDWFIVFKLFESGHTTMLFMAGISIGLSTLMAWVVGLMFVVDVASPADRTLYMLLVPFNLHVLHVGFLHCWSLQEAQSQAALDRSAGLYPIFVMLKMFETGTESVPMALITAYSLPTTNSVAAFSASLVISVLSLAYGFFCEAASKPHAAAFLTTRHHGRVDLFFCMLLHISWELTVLGAVLTAEALPFGLHPVAGPLALLGLAALQIFVSTCYLAKSESKLIESTHLPFTFAVSFIFLVYAPLAIPFAAVDPPVLGKTVHGGTSAGCFDRAVAILRHALLTALASFAIVAHDSPALIAALSTLFVFDLFASTRMWKLTNQLRVDLFDRLFGCSKSRVDASEKYAYWIAAFDPSETDSGAVVQPPTIVDATPATSAAPATPATPATRPRRCSFSKPGASDFIFRNCDANRNGVLSRSEFVAALQMACEANGRTQWFDALSADEIEQHFADATGDASSSESVSYEQFTGWIHFFATQHLLTAAENESAPVPAHVPVNTLADVQPSNTSIVAQTSRVRDALEEVHRQMVAGEAGGAQDSPASDKLNAAGIPGKVADQCTRLLSEAPKMGAETLHELEDAIGIYLPSYDDDAPLKALHAALTAVCDGSTAERERSRLQRQATMAKLVKPPFRHVSLAAAMNPSLWASRGASVQRGVAERMAQGTAVASEVSTTFYDLSRTAERATYFISHNWGDSGRAKQTMLREYLCLQPLVASQLVVLLLLAIYLVPVGLAIRSELATDTLWLVVPAVPLLMLVCSFIWIGLACAGIVGSRLAPWTLSDSTLWVDRCCIDQQQVLAFLQTGGLGSALPNCDCMIAFVTPGYFRRLWCVYELATYCRRWQGTPELLFENLLMLSLEWPGSLSPWKSAELEDEELAPLHSFSCREARCFKPIDRAHVLHEIRQMWGSEDAFDSFVRTILPELFRYSKKRYSTQLNRVLRRQIELTFGA